jgi:hypothetical protein
MPAAVVRAVFGLVPGVVLGAAIGALVWLALRYAGPGDPPPDLALGAGIAAASLGAWFGPSADDTRWGTLSLLGWLTRPPLAAWAGGLAGVGWCAWIIGTWLGG